jgi:hypothetical protein
MKNVVEHIFNGAKSTAYTGVTTYIGPQIIQNTGSTPADCYVSTVPLAIGRPMEAPTPNAVAYPYVISWSDRYDWIFLIGNATAAATRVVVMYEYDKQENIFIYRGYITLTGPGGNLTVRGFRMDYTAYTTGTVEVSGTTVKGTNTQWVTDRMAAGARVGFGSTDPAQITTWYEMLNPTTTAITSDTGFTLLTNAGVYPSGTSYVMEELRVVTTIVSATATNSGLFLVKGLNKDNFQSGGMTFTLSTNIDNLRAMYWLADASSVTMQTPWGCAVDTKSGYTSQDCYTMNGTVSASGYQIYKYNIRAALTPTTGKDTTSLLYKTGVIASSLTGSIITTNNGRLATLHHGVANGVKSYFFVTTTRVYRCDLSTVTNGSTNFITDSMVEVPPGGSSTFAVSTFTGVEWGELTDKLYLSGAAAGRSYATTYQTSSDQFERIFFANDLQYDQSTSASGTPVHPTTTATAMSLFTESGYLYVCRNGTSTALNQIYSIPIKPHREWCDDFGSFVTTPILNTTGCIKFYRVYVNSTRQLGDSTFGCPTEDFDVYYRTTGFESSGGTWTLLGNEGDLTSVGGTNSIQFKIKFKVLGTWCIPSRIYSISVVYEDSTTDSHYTPSVNKSNVVNRIFAYRQSTDWRSNIPNLRIKLYNAATNGLVLDDTVLSSGSGTWQYSTDGTNWNTWNSSADNVGNYIRYTATTLPSGIIVRALLTQ